MARSSTGGRPVVGGGTEGDERESLICALWGGGWNLLRPAGVDLLVTGREKGGVAVALVLVVVAVLLAADRPGLQLPLAIVAGSAAILGTIVAVVRAVTKAALPSSSADRDPANG